MLSELRIKNYALIRDLDVQFQERLSTVTGETGTGKSIMLGALGLILGSRADSSALLDEAKKCVVEGRFRIIGYGLEDFFQRNDLDYDEQTIIRREISPGGKSRGFINDTPVTLNIMKELGEILVDIHSQHQTLRLGSVDFQIGLLDAYAGHRDVLEDYTVRYKEYKRLSKNLLKLQEQAAQAQKEYDFNLFQLEELSKADPQAGEMESLEEELTLLSNAENIQQNLQLVQYALYDDEQSVFNRLSEIRKTAGGLASLNTRLEEFYNRLESLRVEAKDVYAEITDFADSVTVDQERMSFVNERLTVLNHLLNKHHVKDIAELRALMESLQEKVGSVESLSGEIEAIQTELGRIRKELEAMASTLSENRYRHKEDLEENLSSLLRKLGMPEANVRIDVKPTPDLNERGQDTVEILFSANKGSRPGPVHQVASGGELSRIMLCFKYILADSVLLPTMIFDEIDTGVSGEVAIQMGRMMKEMADRHQVLTITHQPQVAAMGNHHYLVYKKAGEEFTATHIRQLTAEERVAEIATMIGGHRPSALALENAKELLTFSE